MSEDIFRITARIRNHRLVKLREDMGWTQSEAARQIGICASRLGTFENLKTSPLARSGNITPTAQRICDFYGVAPSWLFPEDVHCVTKNALEFTASMTELLEAHDDDSDDAGAELRRVMRRLLETLPPRLEWILRNRHGIDTRRKTQAQIANLMGISKARVSVLEAEALNHMRHPSRTHFVNRFAR